MTSGLLWHLLSIFNIPVYLLFGKLVFKGWKEFFQAIHYIFQPDFISFAFGEYGEDQASGIRMLFFAILSIGTVVGEHWIIFKLLMI